MIEISTLPNNEYLTADQKIARLEEETMKALSGDTQETPEASQIADTATEEKAETTPAETETEDHPADAEEPEDAAETEAKPSEEHSQVKPKGQERIQQLANERNDFKQQALNLEKEVARLRKVLGVGSVQGQPSTQSAVPQNTAQSNLPWNQQNPEQQELTQEQLQTIVKQETQTGIQNQRIMDTLNYDIATVEDLYPELREGTKDNPNPDYDANLTTLISELYQAKFEKDHALRFADFVTSIMSLKKQGLEQGKKLAETNAADILKKQAAEDVIDPSGSTDNADQNLETRIKSAKTSKDLAELEKLLPHS